MLFENLNFCYGTGRVLLIPKPVKLQLFKLLKSGKCFSMYPLVARSNEISFHLLKCWDGEVEMDVGCMICCFGAYFTKVMSTSMNYLPFCVHTQCSRYSISVLATLSAIVSVLQYFEPLYKLKRRKANECVALSILDGHSGIMRGL